MGKQGFILLHCQIQEHWLYPADRPFSEYEAWLHLLQMAAHSPHQKFINGKQITINRGEIALSERRIAEMFQWGRKRASRFVEMLEKDGMIRTTEWATKWARLSINNYEGFQVKNGKSEPQSGPQTGPQATPQGIP